jgi:hypothetical protein
MTSAIGRRRTLTERDLGRNGYRRYRRRAARPRREQALHATNEVGILLSMLVAEDEPDA